MEPDGIGTVRLAADGCRGFAGPCPSTPLDAYGYVWPNNSGPSGSLLRRLQPERHLERCAREQRGPLLGRRRVLGYHLERAAHPRWIRQKSAYVPAGRSGGVEETPVGLPSEIGS